MIECTSMFSLEVGDTCSGANWVSAPGTCKLRIKNYTGFNPDGATGAATEPFGNSPLFDGTMGFFAGSIAWFPGPTAVVYSNAAIGQPREIRSISNPGIAAFGLTLEISAIFKDVSLPQWRIEILASWNGLGVPGVDNMIWKGAQAIASLTNPLGTYNRTGGGDLTPSIVIESFQ